MHGINLHAIVRRAITTVNPDETVTLYRSAGQVNTDGIVRPKYERGETVEAQWQPNSENPLLHTEKLNDSKDAEQIFLYTDIAIEVAGCRRQPAATGDMILRGEKWYLVTAILENWSRVGWGNYEVTAQTKPPDFTASDWYEEAQNGD